MSFFRGCLEDKFAIGIGLIAAAAHLGYCSYLDNVPCEVGKWPWDSVLKLDWLASIPIVLLMQVGVPPLIGFGFFGSFWWLVLATIVVHVITLIWRDRARRP
jgi:hypothetical protein